MIFSQKWDIRACLHDVNIYGHGPMAWCTAVLFTAAEKKSNPTILGLTQLCQVKIKIKKPSLTSLIIFNRQH